MLQKIFEDNINKIYYSVTVFDFQFLYMQKHGVFPKLYGIAGVLSYLIYCCFFTNHEHLLTVSRECAIIIMD